MGVSCLDVTWSFFLTWPPPLKHLLCHEIITFPRGEPSWEDEEEETEQTGGRGEGIAWSWSSQERLICHPCLKAICSCQKSGRVGVAVRVWRRGRDQQSVMRADFRRGLYEMALMLLHCPSPHVYIRATCFSYIAVFFLGLSVQPLSVLSLGTHGDYGGSASRHVSDVMTHGAGDNFFGSLQLCGQLLVLGLHRLWPFSNVFHKTDSTVIDPQGKWLCHSGSEEIRHSWKHKKYQRKNK